jgi:L-aminopeptidase/D-esterase-like protein
MSGTLTDVAGLQVGHWTDLEAATGCTVVLCPEGGAAATALAQAVLAAVRAATGLAGLPAAADVPPAPPAGSAAGAPS